MSQFYYHEDELWAESVNLREVAETTGTPCYVYSRKQIEDNWRAYRNAFADYPHQICYAVKANGNLAVLDVLAQLGSGFDIVSLGELRRVQRAGGNPGKVVFSGVGKTLEEIRGAIQSEVSCIDIESTTELERVSRVAEELGRVAPIALRVNPDINPNTHPYISTGLKSTKFGIDIEKALAVYEKAGESEYLEISGVACHIGSQIMDTAPLLESFSRLLDLVEELDRMGIQLEHVDIGGGLGVGYEDGEKPDISNFVASLISEMGKRGIRLPIMMEPGRSIVADAGVLLTRVEYLKYSEVKNFAVVDSGMNDIIRPPLYQAWHDIEPVVLSNAQAAIYDIVGPVCESADVLGNDRELAIDIGDLLAIKDAGAYCAVMASNYNARPRPAEVMVDGKQFQVVRQRETIEDMFALESILD